MTLSKKFIVLLFGLGILSFLGIMLGSVIVPIDSSNELIFKLRVPRTITAIVCGSGIAIAGLLMQTIFRNPLAGPSVLGISSGSTLGVAFGVFALQSLELTWLNEKFSLSILAVLGAMLVTGIILGVSRFVKRSNTLLIVGLMVGYFVSSVVNIFSFYGDKTNLQSFVYWGLGSFNKEVEMDTLFIYYLPIILVIILVFFLQKPLDTLLMGEKYARSMGLNIIKIRWISILFSGILVGVITALCGPIAFLGIAVPHLARNFIHKSSHKWVIPFTLLLGSILGLFCDIIARLPGFDGNLPLNAVTSFIGAPIVVWIVFKNKMV